MHIMRKITRASLDHLIAIVAEEHIVDEDVGTDLQLYHRF